MKATSYRIDRIQEWFSKLFAVEFSFSLHSLDGIPPHDTRHLTLALYMWDSADYVTNPAETRNPLEHSLPVTCASTLL